LPIRDCLFCFKGEGSITIRARRDIILIIVSATRQKNVRQKNEEWVWSSSFFCLTFFCLIGLGSR
jgi:hypothetical protein